MTPEFEFHELADIFPLLVGQEFEELVEDISRNGVIEPVVLYNWKILDGRNRYRAANKAGVECSFIAYGDHDVCDVEIVNAHEDQYGVIERDYYAHIYDDEGFSDFSCEYMGQLDDPAGFVISKNLKRRHLNEQQRAMVAAKLANISAAGRPPKIAPVGAISDGQAAALLNVGERSVERAKAVRRDAVPEVVTAVEAGKLGITAASDFARQPKAEQAEQIAKAASVIHAVKEFRSTLPTKTEANQIARKLEAETGATHAILGRDGKYHSGVTQSEAELGDLYLKMSAALRGIVSMNDTPIDQLIASVSPQSRLLFPALLNAAEQIIVNLKQAWSSDASRSPKGSAEQAERAR